ncbi:MAG: 50S ribosomal protein L3 [Candidatus Saganbacteria bacterium]|nr:50S ribosomal protein L3 [Candidatus Saganbacteria bacterium]
MKSLLGKKIGMTQVFDEGGNMVPVTVIEAGPCVVTQLKTTQNDGYDAIQIGFGSLKKINKPKKGHLKGSSSRYLREFRVSKPLEYKVGQEIKLEIFKPGDILAVSGISIGKGFAGTIKRHHYARGPMSHGSKSHRIPGSIGGGTTPGRVYKGKGMAGRMGGERVTVPNLSVVNIDKAKNIILLKGAVPGKPGNLLELHKVGSAPSVDLNKKAEAKK